MSFSEIFATVFLLGLLGAALAGFVPLFLLVVYVLMSLITMGFYYFDKNAARSGGWRTKESVLHVLALLCGWPGALFAQQWFRHKTQKQPFRAIFLLTVVLNCVGLAVFLLV